MPVTVGLAAAASLVVAVVLTSGGNKPSSDQGALGTAELATRTSSSGLVYDKDLLAAELPALLNGTVAAKAAGPTSPRPRRLNQSAPAAADSAAQDPLTRLRTTDGLASCITALTEGTEVQLPLALDYASFGAQPALVVVLPSSKQSKVDVFVVGAGCAQADAQLLYFARLPAPA